jgi:hypothetical protein
MPGQRLRPRFWHGLLLALLIITAAASTLAAGRTDAGDGSAAGPLVLRVAYDTIDQLTGLARYDVWENDLAHDEVVIGGSTAVLESLRRSGWAVRVDPAATARLLASDAPAAFSGGYRTVDELYADMDQLAAGYPGLVTPFTYGRSHCKQAGGCTALENHSLSGFDLRAIRITDGAVPGSSVISGETIARGTKPVLFLMANIHAREITTPELVMRFAEWLLEGYGQNADATWIVEHHEIWIVPTANPDGHWIVELGAAAFGAPFYHRKNFDVDADGDGDDDCVAAWADVTQLGVDLNRNHSFKWGTPGASDDPCDLTFRGPAAASEPEVEGIQTLVGQLFADRRGPGAGDAAPADTGGVLITVHSYGNLVLWPWGYENGGPAPNRPELKAIGDKLASFSGSLSCQPTECLYAASGTTDDWAYGELGIPAFTFEVGNQFMPPYQAIDAVQWPAFGPAFVYAARIARAPYQLAFGPDALSVEADAQDGNLSATMTDADNGQRPVVSAEYAIDVPFWVPGAQPVPMQAADGAFDEVEERVTSAFVPDDLSPGRHVVYVRGTDDQGHTGPLSAVFVSVTRELDFRSYLPAAIRP